MPLDFPDKAKGADESAPQNGKIGGATDSRVFARGPFDAADEIDVVLSRHFAQISNLISDQNTAHSSGSAIQAQLQERASVSVQFHSSIVFGILYGILADFNSRNRLFSLLRAVTRDNHAALIGTILKFCQEKWPKLKQEARQGLLWLVEQLLFDLEINDAEVSLLCLVRQMASGDVSEPNIWLASQLLSVLNSHKAAMYRRPQLLTGAVFSYLRLLADHWPSQRASVKSLAIEEANFVVAAIRERFQDCLAIGRDLARLLQDVAAVPEIQELWKDLLVRPETFGVPGFKDIRQMYAARTPTRYIALRVTFEMEQQLRFLLTHVQMGEQRRYQTWFALKYLSTAESESLVCDLIRFICCVIHPTNQILQSNIVPRWAVIGWLLKCCRSAHVESNAKLALLYDWLFFNPQTDNLMNIEPAILCIFYSLPKYAELSNSLLEFLFLMVDHYDEDRVEVLTQGVRNSVDILVGKGVVANLHLLSESPHIPLLIRERVQVLFPAYCRIKPPNRAKDGKGESKAGADKEKVLSKVMEEQRMGREEKTEKKDGEGQGRAMASKSALRLVGDDELILERGRVKEEIRSVEELEEGEEGVFSSTGALKVTRDVSDVREKHEQGQIEEMEEEEEEEKEEETTVEEEEEEMEEEKEEGVEEDGGKGEESVDVADPLSLRKALALSGLIVWGSDAESLKLRERGRKNSWSVQTLVPEPTGPSPFLEHLTRLKEDVREVWEKGVFDGKNLGADSTHAAADLEGQLLVCLESFLNGALDTTIPASFTMKKEPERLTGGEPGRDELAGQVEDAGPPKRRRTGDLHGVSSESEEREKASKERGDGSGDEEGGRSGSEVENENLEEKAEREAPVMDGLADCILKLAQHLQVPLFRLPQPGKAPKLHQDNGEKLCNGNEDLQKSSKSVFSLLLVRHTSLKPHHKHRVPQILQQWQRQSALEVTAWALMTACHWTEAAGEGKEQGRRGSDEACSSTTTTEGSVAPNFDLNSTEVEQGLEEGGSRIKESSSGQKGLSKWFKTYWELNQAADGKVTSGGSILHSVSNSRQGTGKNQQQENSSEQRNSSDRRHSPASRKRKRLKSIEQLTAGTEAQREDSGSDAQANKETERETTPLPFSSNDSEQVLNQTVADVETCLIFRPESPPQILPQVFRNLPEVCCSTPRLIQILVLSLDPPLLAGIEMEVAVGSFSLMGSSPGEADFRKVLTESAQWDWLEQQWLWRLLTAEGVRWEERTWLSLTAAVQGVKSSTQTKLSIGGGKERGSSTDQPRQGEEGLVSNLAFLVSGLTTALKAATPTQNLVSQVIALPPEMFKDTAAAVLVCWAMKHTKEMTVLLQELTQEESRQIAPLVEALRQVKPSSDGTAFQELLHVLETRT